MPSVIFSADDVDEVLPAGLGLEQSVVGIQNFPEGTAVSLPLRREGLSRGKSFWYGQLSALVEPISGVAEELIPESRRQGNTQLATAGLIVGFAIMMTLNATLG